MKNARVRALTTTLSAVALSFVSLGGTPTAGSEPEIKPFNQVDQPGWRAALKKHGALNPNLPMLYDVVAKNYCTNTVDELALGFTLTGANPPMTRTNMSYVCPSRAYMVDAALAQLQETDDTFARACATAPSMRTTEQQELIDAVPSACM